MADWLSSSTAPWLGLALGLLMPAFAVIALWRIRVPGPVTEGERARRRALSRRSVRLAGLSVLAGPALIVLAGWQLAFPVRRPTTVLLVSRSRPQSPSLLAEWKNKAGTLLVPAGPAQAPGNAVSTLDAGLLVDEACKEMLKRQRPEWRRDDSETAQAVREALREVLRTDRVEAARGAEARGSDALFGDKTCGEHLPRWLVESLEMSLLRGLLEVVNAVEVRGVVAGRRSSLGLAWTGVDVYLKQEADRAVLHDLKVTLDAVPEPEGVRVAGVLGPLQTAPPNGATARVLLSVPENFTGPFEPLPLRLRNPKEPSIASEEKLEITADKVGRIFPFTATFSRIPQSLDRLEVAFEGSEIWFPVDRSRGEKLERVVEVRAKPPLLKRWLATQAALHVSASNPDPALMEWQSWLQRFGLDFETLSFIPGDCDGGLPKGDVIVDACPDPALGSDDPVRVYPYPAAGNPLEGAPGRISPVEASFHWRGRVTRYDLPGPYSLDAMPLAPDHFAALRISGACVSTLAQTVADDFAHGTAGKFESFPLIASWKVPNGQLTSLGFSFRAQGMLLGPDQRPVPNEPYDLGRLLSGWTQLLLAIDRAGDNKSDCEMARLVEDDATHPTSYLDATELDVHHNTGTLGSLATFSLGLAAYGAFVLRGLGTGRSPR